MSLSEFGFGDLNDTMANLQDFKKERKQTLQSLANVSDTNIGADTNTDETGKLLFPGQQIARRSTMINQQIKDQLESEQPVLMRKKTQWAKDSSDDEDEDESDLSGSQEENEEEREEEQEE